MAVAVKNRRLVNSGKNKRKLSPKQIAIFGTARQKAALRASRSRKRNAGVNSIRKTKKRGVKVTKAYGSPYSNWRVGKRKRAKKRNVGEIVSISLAGLAGNPGKRRRNSGMAKRRRKAVRTVGARKTVRRRRRNTGVARKRVMHRRRRIAVARMAPRRRRRSNPMYRVRRVHRRRNAGVSKLSGVIGKSLAIIGGAVGTRYLTQFALGGNNTGVIGYLGNAVAAVALGWATTKVTKSQELGKNVMIGGAVSTVLRIIQDKTSLGSFINLSLQGAGKGGDIGMGIIQDSSFFSPQVASPGSMTQFVTPRGTRSYVSAQMAQADQMRAAASRGPAMGTVYGRNKRAVS